jgi:tRNA (adenine37-N6)-methyltransferase
LTTVRLQDRTGTTLKVKGLDVLDGTPIIDIKPFYPPYDTPRGELKVPQYISKLKF